MKIGQVNVLEAREKSLEISMGSKLPIQLLVHVLCCYGRLTAKYQGERSCFRIFIGEILSNVEVCDVCACLLM